MHSLFEKKKVPGEADHRPRRRTCGLCAMAFASSLVVLGMGLAWGQNPTGERGTVESAAPAAQPSTAEFVAVPDLASQLKKIDANASIEWDGRRLRISVKGQRFTLFLTNADVVVNGTPQRVSSPLRVYQGELYVPQDAVDLLASELAKTSATGSTPTPSPTPTPTATPQPTPTVAPTPTKTPLPSPSATSEPAKTPTPTPSPVAPPEATRRPTPVASPAPTISIEVRPSTKATPAMVRTSPQPGGDVYARLIREREELVQSAPKPMTRAELDQAARLAKASTILIDPDEGVTNEASSDVRRQSHLTLQLAMKLKMRLVSQGYQVTLTREDPQYVSLARKVETIRRSGGHLLVSLRVGANPSASVSGIRILYPSATTDYAVGKPELTSGDLVPVEQTYVPFAEKSKTLASLCLAALKSESSNDTVTMLPAPLYLAKRAPMPAVAIVLGNLSNPADRKRLLDEGQQERLADLIAQAVAQGAQGTAPRGNEGTPTPKGGQTP